MSNNQKQYFNYDVGQLQRERKKNDALVGAFAIAIGLITIISAFPLHMLYTEMALKWKPAMSSRLPEFEPHEQVDFVFKCIRDDDDVQQDQNYMPGSYQEIVPPEQESESKFDENDERDEQFLVEKDQEIAEQQMRMQFGAIPGQKTYDPYATNNDAVVFNRGGFRSQQPLFEDENDISGSPNRYY